MEPDEFASWQDLKDITPPTKPVRDLDIPDEPAAVVEPVPEPVIDQTVPEPLNPAEFLRRLEDERALCNSETDLEELRQANAAVIATLKPRDRKKADAILASE